MSNAFRDIKYKKTVIFCVLVWLVRFFCIASFVYPRVFGSDIQKAFYGIGNIINSQNIHRRYDNHFLPSSGGYDTRYDLINENERVCFSYGIDTDDTFESVIQNTELLKNEINGFISDSIAFNNNAIEIYLEIDCVGYGKVILKNCYESIQGSEVYTKELRHIFVGQSDWIAGYGAVTTMAVLPYISSFEAVSLGGYWGDELIIPKALDKSDFDSFTDLKQLEVFCEESDEEFTRKVLSGLNSVDIRVNREYCVNGVWTSR